MAYTVSDFMTRTPIRACMSAEVLTVSSDRVLIEAAKLMRDHKIGGLPVEENDSGEQIARSVCDDCPCDNA